MRLETKGDATTLENYNAPRHQMKGEEPVGARAIPPSRRSITGLFPSRKNDGLVPFESALERDLMLMLEFSPSVVSYEAQPVKLSYRTDSGRRVNGYPDLLVRYHHGPPMLCDVKYRSELKEKWDKLKPRLKAAFRYAQEQGWSYHLRTEREIRTPCVENARFLLPYARRTPNRAHEHLIMTTLKAAGQTTIQELLEASCAYDWNRAQIIPTLWCLIGRRNIVADLDRPVGISSVVWYPDWP
jgi:TnsA endonuclease N terminal/TnsA endonuclease C terminal